jgi:hypothetical protein
MTTCESGSGAHAARTWVIEIVPGSLVTTALHIITLSCTRALSPISEEIECIQFSKGTPAYQFYYARC